MANRVRYYITENDDHAVVKSVPVTVCSQPANELMSIEKRSESTMTGHTPLSKPIGRIVKVLRKPTNTATGA